jgi:hypothetical protein
VQAGQDGAADVAGQVCDAGDDVAGAGDASRIITYWRNSRSRRAIPRTTGTQLRATDAIAGHRGRQRCWPHPVAPGREALAAACRAQLLMLMTPATALAMIISADRSPFSR